MAKLQSLPQSKAERMKLARSMYLANVQAGKSAYDGWPQDLISEYNRALMFGMDDEAFPSQEEWSRVTD